MRKKRMKRGAAGCICILVLLALCFSSCAPRYETLRGYGMGSYLTVTAVGREAEGAVGAVSLLENNISHRVSTSTVARLNAGERVVLDTRLAELLALAEQISEKTEGRFSLYCLPLTRLWDFETEAFAPPTEQALAAALEDMQNAGISVDASGAVLTGGALDLGSVGKGYAAAELAARYADTAHGCLFSVGGSIAAVGTKNGTPWRIGIRDPFGDVGEVLGYLSLSDLAVSTSGSYEKTRVYDGVTYHHILDATTGLPARSGLVSVTVVAEDGALTDLLSTAGFIVGADACFALCEEYGARAVVVTEEGEILVSAALADLFEPETGKTVQYR